MPTNDIGYSWHINLYNLIKKMPLVINSLWSRNIHTQAGKAILKNQAHASMQPAPTWLEKTAGNDYTIKSWYSNIVYQIVVVRYSQGK